MKKSEVISALDELPSEFSAEQLIEKLLFMEKVKEGMSDVKNGQTVHIEEAISMYKKKWQR